MGIVEELFINTKVEDDITIHKISFYLGIQYILEYIDGVAAKYDENENDEEVEQLISDEIDKIRNEVEEFYQTWQK